MRNLSILIVVATALTTVIAVPTKYEHQRSNIVPLKKQRPSEVDYDEIIQQTVITVAQIQIAFVGTYAKLEAALSEAAHAETYAHVKTLIEGAEKEAANIFSAALGKANPEMPLEDLAVLVHDTFAQLGLVFFQAIFAVEKVVDTEAPETLPQIHGIILGLQEELEVAAKPLVDLITPFLPHD